MTITEIKIITDRITMSLLNTNMDMRVEHDNECSFTKSTLASRIFLQVIYKAPCTKTGELKEWHGRKWYLSKYMTDDEIIKTAFAAFQAAVIHEVMEGFKVDGVILFNPHVSYTELLKISHIETKRHELQH